VKPKQKRPGQTGSGDRLASGFAVAALALLSGFISLPILSLVIWTVNEGSWRAMGSPVALDALLLSAQTTAITMVIIFAIGTPAAFVLARAEFPGKRLVNALIDIPAVLPPSAAGIALLLAGPWDTTQLHHCGGRDGRTLRRLTLLRAAGRRGFR
jgi:ABC-type sulfate transport system permease component